MAVFFYMPKLGLNMVEGTILNWLVEEGDLVRVGQAIVEIETDKASQELESPAAGTLARITRHLGEVVPCNTVMAVILKEGEVMPAVIPVEIVEGVTPRSELGGKPNVEVSLNQPTRDEARGDQERIAVSPAAKALAKELGVNIADIKPRGGRITREDIEAANNAKKGEPALTKTEMTSIRRKISSRMSESARATARVGMSLEADASALCEYKEEGKRAGINISYNVLLAKLASVTLKEFPYMNTRMDGDAILQMHDINIGIAVDTPAGLMVPVLKHVDQKNISALQAEYTSVIRRALDGQNRVEDLQGGTFTITNLGSLDIESFLPVINYPECAILGVGAIIRKPVVVENEIVIRRMLTLTLAFDHRLVDGAPAGRFLQHLKHLVEQVII